MMAVISSTKHQLLAFALISVSLFRCKFGNAETDMAQNGAIFEDPTQVVGKALVCFNDKSIYSSCEEEYRLTESGNIHVPLEYTDQFCDGPCLAETHLVLNCIDNILTHFEFYNKATVKDVRDTIKAGCSYGSHRGNFDVAEHIEAEENNANKTAISVLFGLILIVTGHVLLL